MNRFDVLNPHFGLTGKFFVQASAGCGKTFSMEHAVVRLLLGEVLIEQIVILTFTNEATSELKVRIKNAITQAKDQIVSGQAHLSYLQECLSLEDEAKQKVIKKLSQALLDFESAQIFTIHKFCFLKLQELLFDANQPLTQDPDLDGLSPDVALEIVLDGFASRIDKEHLHPIQFELLMGYYGDDFTALLKDCLKYLSKEVEIIQPPSYQNTCYELTTILTQLKKLHGLTSESLLSTLSEAASFFKGTQNKQQQIKEEVEQQLHSFSNLFEDPLSQEQLIESCVSFFKITSLFDEQGLKKKHLDNQEALKCLKLIRLIDENCRGYFERLCSKESLLNIVLYHCNQLLAHYIKRHDIVTPQNILEKFAQLTNLPSLASKASAHYRAVIVDEFQDTDPLQWQILSNLFLKESSGIQTLIVVGDPKQSIYGFRKADIYTYLKACQNLQIERPHVLDTNYRSQPQLIEALNHLFTITPNPWIELPKTQGHLPYQPVNSDPSIEPLEFGDQNKALHLVVMDLFEQKRAPTLTQIEQQYLFPYIKNEIEKLQHKAQFSLSQFAVLVKDRFQASRLKEFFKNAHIAFTSNRADSLQGKKSVQDFYYIWRAALFPKNIQYLYFLKINGLLNLDAEHFSPEKISALVNYFFQLKAVLDEQGVSAFFNQLTTKPLMGSHSLYHQLLSRKNGLYLYQELEQIKSLLLEQEAQGATLHQMQLFLEELVDESKIASKAYPLRQNFEEDAVHILTMHMSKGLEFDVVFPIGVIAAQSFSETFVVNDDNQLLAFNRLSDQDQKNYQSEVDAEKLRALYVALTRAKHRLYLPLVMCASSQVSMMDLYLDQHELSKDQFCDLMKSSSCISYEKIQKDDSLKIKWADLKPKLTHPKLFLKTYPKQYKLSYSSLASKVKADEALATPQQFDCELQSVHTLPAGAHTGNLIHSILEKINFNQPFDVLPYIQNSPFEAWNKVIFDWVQAIVKAPIPLGNHEVSLSELESNMIYKEMEFLFSYEQVMSHLPELKPVHQHLLNGFIDLIVFHEGRYYIIDYKTNWLGESGLAYQNLESAFYLHQYELQAEIYQLALKQYLSIYEKRPFEDCFGGTLYWFVRGVQSESRGLYHYLPATK